MARKRQDSLETLIASIHNIFSLLPDEQEKTECVNTLQKTIAFLQRIAEAISQFPTKEELVDSGLPAELDRLAGFLKAARQRASKPRAAKSSPQLDLAKINQFLDELKQLPEAELRARITSGKLNKAEWEEAVKRAGGQPRSRSNIAGLKDQLAQTIINQRTHEGLLGGARP